LLVYSRLIMFLLLGYVFYVSVPENNLVLKGYVVLSFLIFIINHFLLFMERYKKRVFYLILLDGLVSFSLGFLFYQMSLYLILLGVVAVTITIHESDPKRLRLSMVLFFLLWMMVVVYSERMTGEWGVMNNLISASFVGFGAIVGNLIRKLYDAQETMDRQYKQLNESHEALTDVHQQLRQYSDQVEELTTIRERNRIAREIHDTVGHKMTALLVQLELARALLKLDVHKAETTLETCDGLARGALQELRFSVRTLHEDKGEERSLIPMIRTMLNDFYNSAHVVTEFDLKGDPAIVPISLQPTLIRLIQEALTNAKKHGAASFCYINLSCSEEAISVLIKDNGLGTGSISKGFGLINMKERIEEHGGSVTFESMEGGGFQIKVQFPLLKRKWIAGRKNDKSINS